MNQQLKCQNHRLGCLVLCTAWLAFTAPLWTENGNSYLGDAAFLDVPLRIYAGRAIRSGWFPFWTDQLAAGLPLFAESQTGMAYPPFWLYVIYPYPKATEWYLALHYLIFGLGMYALARHLGARSLGASLSATLAMTSWGMRVMHCSPAFLAGLAWLPCSLWLVGQSTSGRKWAIWLSAVTTSFAILPGAPHVFILTVPLCISYWVYLHWAEGWWERCRGVVILSAAPLLLGAVQLWPFWNYYVASNRRELSMHVLAESNGTQWTYFLPWGFLSHEPQNMEEPLRAVWPSHVVYAFSVVVAAVGLLRIRRLRFWRYWIVMALVSLAASMDTPLLWLVMATPPFSLTRYPGQFLFGGSVVASLLMAHGFSQATALLENGQRRLKAIALAGIACILTVNWLASDLSGYLSDGPFYNEKDNALVEDIEAWKVRDGHVRQFAPQSSASLGRSDGMWRESQWRRNAAGMAVDYNLLHGVPSIDQYDLLDGTAANSRLYWFSQLMAQGELNAFRAGAVTHLSLAPTAPVPPSYQRIPSGVGHFYRSQEPRPPAWMVFETELVVDRAARCERLAQSEFNPYRVAIVETPSLELDESPAEPPLVETVPNVRGRKEFNVNTAARGLLVISNTYYRQLQAHVDGEESAVLPVNQAFCGVVLPPGRHHVVLSYNLHEIYLGFAVSILSLGFVAWRIWVQLPRRLTAPAGSRDEKATAPSPGTLV